MSKSISVEQLNPVLMVERLNSLQKSIELLQNQMSEASTINPEWIKLNLFCAKTGETSDSVKKLRDGGYLAEGVHWKKRPGSNVIYMNIVEYNRWLANGMG